MNILIIGSKGFIGSHCVEYFRKKNTVWKCDVVTDYVSDNYHLVDATNADYSEIFQQAEFDYCINCSGASSVPDSIKNPHRDFVLNTLNVHKQLDAIRKYNKNCRYINLSSAAVYGNPTSLPVKESQKLNPISPYGAHKKMAEELCKMYYTQFGIECCSLRIFSAYGNGLKKQLFWDLYQKSKKNNEVVLFGTGLESRDFIHITDILTAINSVISIGEFKGDSINIANGIENTIEFVSSLFFEILNSSGIKLKFDGNYRKGDPINWAADIEKLKAIGYHQSIDLKDGLKSYIKWLKESE